MPYKSIEELPDDVREALPAPAQRIFLKVANKALDGGAAEEKAFKAAWAAVKIAGFRKQKDGKWKKAVEGEMAEDKLLALCEVQPYSPPPPKDWETVDDLDISVRAELPPEAQAIFLDAYKAVASVSGIDHWQAMEAGWNAVREAGWHYPVQQWVKISTEGSDAQGEAAAREKAKRAAEQFIADGGGDLVALIGRTGEFRFLNAMPLEAGEVPDWIQVLPAPGSWEHPRYGEIKITDEVLAEFQANFQNEVYQKHIPIDAEHETTLSGAMGYYEEMVIGGPAGEAGLWAKVDWTDRGKELLESERFKYFSPAWFEEWEDPASRETFHNVLNGGALTTKPFFKDSALKPLVAREGGMWEVTLTEEGKADRWIELRRGNVAPAERKEEDSILPEKMTEDQLRELVETASKKAVETATGELKAEVATHKQATDLANMAREGAEKRVKTLEDDARQRRFIDIVMGRDPASDGARPMIGDAAAHVRLLKALAETKGEDSEEFTQYVYIQRSHAKQAHDAGLFKELGAGGGGDLPETADAEVQKLVDKRMSEKPDLTRAEAVSQVATENPALWEKRDREHTGRKTPLPN